MFLRNSLHVEWGVYDKDLHIELGQDGNSWQIDWGLDGKCLHVMQSENRTGS